jgi:hypothetical protein
VEVAPVEGPNKEITRKEIEDAIELVKSNKALGSTGVRAGILKALGQDDVGWLHVMLNSF